MEKQFNSPAEVLDLSLNSCETKTKLPLGKMVLLGIMAGMFIALGAATSNTASHAISDVGIARLVTGAIFPIGLMLIIFLGGELFTGNCLIIVDILDKRVKIKSLLRNLIVVYFANLIGSIIIALLVFYSGNLNYSGGLLGAYTIKIAISKVSISPIAGITSGILCNILVCAAVLMATSANAIAGKIWGIFFPIMAFVIGGFEHCVANMYYIPAGMLAASNSDYVAKAKEVYGITADQIASLTVGGGLRNLLPVTLGNILGGMIFVGLPLYLIAKKPWKMH